LIVKVLSSALSGINAYIVDVEVDINIGLPAMAVVGLPDTAVQESKERVKTAIKNSGFNFPAKKIVINLAPADTKKEGPSFDLPIAIGVLGASEQLEIEKLKNFMIIGELSLDGTVRSVNGTLCYAITAKENNIPNMIVPYDNAPEASVVNGLKIYPVKNLKEAYDVINNTSNFTPIERSIDMFNNESENHYLDFSDIKGQEIFYTKIMCNT